ncbi:probable ubiquitin carboxyl-terminal hydrolase MINDY-4 isoform X2 [Halichondria panicea]|uniref:probable ubiquitin carboxyl-terminal hydrolase MINDY-4 isoform X2 n=1 Tax=Halichondria panicea TaxID=6063 RepID=UPI00312B3837
MTQYSVEELSLSLVREFLSRKGLKATLTSLDTEAPRGERSISNRGALAKAVSVERLMRKNKEQPQPYRTMIEVIVHSLSSKTTTSTSRSHELPSKSPSPQVHSHTVTSTTPPGGNPIAYTSTTSSDPNITEPSRSNPLFSSPPVSRFQQRTSSATPSTATTGRDAEQYPSSRLTTNPRDKSVLKTNPVGSNTRGGVMQAGCKTSGKKFKPRSLAELNSTIDKPETTSLPNETPAVSSGVSRHSTLEGEPRANTLFGGVASDMDQPPAVPCGSSTAKKTSTAAAGDLLVFDDLDDLELGEGWSSVAPLSNQNAVFPKGHPITVETAQSLRHLLFGTSKGPSFSQEWRRQNFEFSDIPGLEYGLVQHKGGPCGVLAAVQTFILKHLMFSDSSKPLNESPRPSPDERREGLVSALGEILWRAGGGKRAVVGLLSSAETGYGKATPTYKPDNITERMIEHTFTDRNTMDSFLRSRLALLQDGSSSGCIQFLLSVLLTKGVSCIQSEMDEVNGRLIGSHGYCTQELVNLLLTGVAVSNVFDGEMNLGSKGSEELRLRGLSKQSEIGLLSLFEHYQSCKVGSNYKNPIYPIWVICSESHFSVLFSHERLLLENPLQKRFDLHYFDGLANQDKAIRLTIDNAEGRESLVEDGLTPPLELCIRTKWKSVTVSWNGSEPIL